MRRENNVGGLFIRGQALADEFALYGKE